MVIRFKHQQSLNWGQYIHIVGAQYSIASHSNTRNVTYLLNVKHIGNIDSQITNEDGFSIDLNKQE